MPKRDMLLFQEIEISLEKHSAIAMIIKNAIAKKSVNISAIAIFVVLIESIFLVTL